MLRKIEMNTFFCFYFKVTRSKFMLGKIAFNMFFLSLQLTLISQSCLLEITHKSMFCITFFSVHLQVYGPRTQSHTYLLLAVLKLYTHFPNTNEVSGISISSCVDFQALPSQPALMQCNRNKRISIFHQLSVPCLASSK